MFPFLHNKQISWPSLQPFMEKCSSVLKESHQTISTTMVNYMTTKDTTTLLKRSSSADRRPQINFMNSLQTISDDLRKLSISVKEEDLIVKIVEFMSENNFSEMIVKNLQCLNHMGVLRNPDVFRVAFSLYTAVLNISDLSVKFATQIAEAGIMHLLYENLCLCRHPDYGQESSTRIRLLVKVSLGIMNNIVRRDGNTHYFLQEWILTIREVIYLRRTESDRCLALIILAYVLDDDNVLNILSVHSDIVSTLLNMTMEADKMNSDKRRYQGFSMEELLDVQISITTHDIVKEEFLKHNGLEVMKSLCRKEYPSEANRASQIICNILFNPSLKEKLKEKCRLENFLKHLITETWPSDTQNNIVMALWLLRSEKYEKPSHLSGSFRRIAQEENIIPTARRGVTSMPVNVISVIPVNPKLFISYSHADKSIVHNVNNYLVQAGYSVWIDDHQIQGNTMDLIADAIENSSIVLICMSEAYKMSHYCQMEAKYASSLKKNLVFLVLQQHYHPNGWLGLLLSDNYYYDFSGRRNFEVVINTLLKYLKEICPLRFD